MTKYAQHKFPGISKLASDLVAKWKKEVQLEARRAGPRTDASSNVGRASPPREPQRTEPTAEPAKEEEDRSVPKSRVREADVEYAEQVKLEEQSESFDEYISKHKARDDKARRKIQESIHKCLLKQDPSNSKKAEANAIKVEIGLFKLYQGKPADYSNKARTILANLMRSDDFKKHIMTGIINPEEVASMDPKDMTDDKLKLEREQKEKDIIDSKRSDFMIANMKVKDGMFTCRKCKGKRTTFYEQQTRSSDEPMTTFVHCLDCGHHMKF